MSRLAVGGVLVLRFGQSEGKRLDDLTKGSSKFSVGSRSLPRGPEGECCLECRSYENKVVRNIH